MAAWRVGVSPVAGFLIAVAACGVDRGGLPPHIDAGANADRPPHPADAGAPSEAAADAGSADASTPPVVTQPTLCEPDGWCWVNPLPQGRGLVAVWGSSPRDVWASLATPGRFLHRSADGTWAFVASGSELVVSAIWGTGPTSVWAVGNVPGTLGNPGVILHWDGSRWSEAFRTQEGLHDIHGSAPDDVWAVGAGTVVRFDGGAWRVDEVASALLSSNWGAERVVVTARDDVWIAEGQTLWRWNGAAWRSEDAGPSRFIQDIWAIAPDMAFRSFFGEFNQVIERWDGSAWQPSLAADRGPVTITALSGSAANDVWAVDTAGTAYHFDGSTWTVGLPATGVFTTGLWADTPGVAMTVGGGGEIRELSGGVWRRVTQGPFAHLAAVHGSGANVWFGGAAILLRWDGGALREVPLPPGVPAPIIATVWAPDEYTVFVGGFNGFLAMRDGTRWTTFSVTSDNVSSVWAASPSDAWMATFGRQLFRWDGRVWSPVAFPFGFSPTHVHGTGVDDVWVGGSTTPAFEPAVARWNGREWTLLPLGGGGDLWVNAPDDIWSRGPHSHGETVNHFDGTAWTQLRFFFQEGVGDIWSPGAGEAYVGGGDLRHFVNGGWIDRDMPPLFGIWGTGRNDIWTAGAGGAILRRLTPAASR